LDAPEAGLNIDFISARNPRWPSLAILGVAGGQPAIRGDMSMSAILSTGTLISAAVWLMSLPIIGFALRCGEFHRTAPLAVFEAAATGRDRRCEAPSSLI
jgi:hypothetical protein